MYEVFGDRVEVFAIANSRQDLPKLSWFDDDQVSPKMET
jgi:hypothetical protein